MNATGEGKGISTLLVGLLSITEPRQQTLLLFHYDRSSFFAEFYFSTLLLFHPLPVLSAVHSVAVQCHLKIVHSLLLLFCCCCSVSVSAEGRLSLSLFRLNRSTIRTTTKRQFSANSSSSSNKKVSVYIQAYKNSSSDRQTKGLVYKSRKAATSELCSVQFVFGELLLLLLLPETTW